LLGCSLIEEIMAGRTRIHIEEKEPPDRLFSKENRGNRSIGDGLAFPEFKAMIRRTLYEVCRYSPLGMALLKTIAYDPKHDVILYPAKSFYPHIGGSGVNSTIGFPDDFAYSSKVNELVDLFLKGSHSAITSSTDPYAVDLQANDPVIQACVTAAAAVPPPAAPGGPGALPPPGAPGALPPPGAPGTLPPPGAPGALPPPEAPPPPGAPGALPPPEAPPPPGAPGVLPPPGAPGAPPAPEPPGAPKAAVSGPPGAPGLPAFGAKPAAKPAARPSEGAITFAVKRHLLKKIGAAEPGQGCESHFYFNTGYVRSNFRDAEYQCRLHEDFDAPLDLSFGGMNRKVQPSKTTLFHYGKTMKVEGEKDPVPVPEPVIIETPLFLAFLHEMIHARRFQTGASGEYDEYPEAVPAANTEPPYHPDSMMKALHPKKAAPSQKLKNFISRYGKFNREEFDTIEGGGTVVELDPVQLDHAQKKGLTLDGNKITLTENTLRKELGLPLRRRYEDGNSEPMDLASDANKAKAEKRCFIKPGNRETSPETPPATPFVLTEYLEKAQQKTNELFAELGVTKQVPLMVRDDSYFIKEPAHYILGYQFSTVIKFPTGEESTVFCPAFLTEMRANIAGVPESVRDLVQGVLDSTDDARRKAIRIMQHLFTLPEPELMKVVRLGSTEAQKSNLEQVYGKAQHYDAFAGFKIDLGGIGLDTALDPGVDISSDMQDALAAYLPVAFREKDSHLTLHTLIHEPMHLLSFQSSGFIKWKHEAGTDISSTYDVVVNGFAADMEKLPRLYELHIKPRYVKANGTEFGVDVTIPTRCQIKVSEFAAALKLSLEKALNSKESIAQQENYKAKDLEKKEELAGTLAKKEGDLKDLEAAIAAPDAKPDPSVADKLKDEIRALAEEIRELDENLPKYDASILQFEQEARESAQAFDAAARATKDIVAFTDVPKDLGDQLKRSLDFTAGATNVSLRENRKLSTFFLTQILNVPEIKNIPSVLDEGTTELFTRIISHRLNREVKTQAVRFTKWGGFYAYETPLHVVCQIVRDLGPEGLKILAAAYFLGKFQAFNDALVELAKIAPGGRYTTGFWTQVARLPIPNDQVMKTDEGYSAALSLRDDYGIGLKMPGDLIESVIALEKSPPGVPMASDKIYHDPVCCFHAYDSGAYTYEKKPLAAEALARCCWDLEGEVPKLRNPEPLPFKCPNCEAPIEIPGEDILKT
ncbi:MAG TPA: hypothetical protein VFZ49_01190, partial [Pyrinomonadaceae bacterium]